MTDFPHGSLPSNDRQRTYAVRITFPSKAAAERADDVEALAKHGHLQGRINAAVQRELNEQITAARVTELTDPDYSLCAKCGDLVQPDQSDLDPAVCSPCRQELAESESFSGP